MKATMVARLTAGFAVLASMSGVLLSQTRDAVVPQRPAFVGTAGISGRVLTDDTPGRGLRRVTVTVAETGSGVASRVAITDDTGHFAFRDLPAGRYVVSASRAPYLPTSYGARRAARPGAVPSSTPIVVADGQKIADVTLKLSRGAVVTGIVRDATGQPAQGFSVALSYFQRSFTTGERTLTPYYSAGSSGLTDDRGMYRIFGLPPGEYVVSASPGFSRLTDLVPTTDADVQRAMDLIQRPGAQSAGPSPGVSLPAPRRPTVGYVPAYYPGTTVLGNATPITLGAGEERSGVDFQVQLVSTARVDGTIVGPTGAPVAGVSVRALSSGPASSVDMSVIMGSSATTDAQGRFALAGLSPGAYSVQARGNAPGAGPGGLWAAAEVTIQGQDETLNLALRPGLTMTGRLAFEGTSPAPPDLTKIRVVLSQVTTGISLGAPAPTVAATGEFVLNGVTPGRYRLSAIVPGLPTAPGSWVVKSSMLNGQDALDTPAEITVAPGPIEALITLTDRSTELSGTMTDASGKPAPEYFIIVFSAERSHWAPQSRRIMQTRPAQDGKFIFRSLPPGNYLLAAVTDVEQGEWFDPAFLGQLVDASIRVTLADNEKKVQDIRIR